MKASMPFEFVPASRDCATGDKLLVTSKMVVPEGAKLRAQGDVERSHGFYLYTIGKTAGQLLH